MFPGYLMIHHMRCKAWGDRQSGWCVSVEVNWRLRSWQGPNEGQQINFTMQFQTGLLDERHVIVLWITSYAQVFRVDAIMPAQLGPPE